MVVLFTCVVAATHDRYWALGLCFILGIVLGPVMVAPNTVINKLCPMEMSGKVFAAMEFVVYLAFMLAMLVSSFLSEHIDRFWILVAVGGIFMVVGLIGVLKGEE
jgi:MFS family permease